MKHIHADLIHQWADGAKIQIKLDDGIWVDTNNPHWYTDSIYRIKPKETTTRIEWVPVYSHRWGGRKDSVLKWEMKTIVEVKE